MGARNSYSIQGEAASVLNMVENHLSWLAGCAVFNAFPSAL